MAVFLGSHTVHSLWSPLKWALWISDMGSDVLLGDLTKRLWNRVPSMGAAQIELSCCVFLNGPFNRGGQNQFRWKDVPRMSSRTDHRIGFCCWTTRGRSEDFRGAVKNSEAFWSSSQCWSTFMTTSVRYNDFHLSPPREYFLPSNPVIRPGDITRRSENDNFVARWRWCWLSGISLAEVVNMKENHLAAEKKSMLFSESWSGDQTVMHI